MANRSDLPPIPGMELPAFPRPDGKPSPYASSGLRSVTGTKISDQAWESWYQDRAQTLVSPDSPKLSCVYPQMELWLRVMGGLDPQMQVTQPPAQDWPLTRVIPRLNAGKSGIPFQVPEGHYWVDYGSFSSSLQHLPDRDWTYEITSRFPDPNRVTLGFISQPLLSWVMWRNRFSLWGHPFFQQFRQGGIVSPDFSAWINDPRPQALVGERMTQQFVSMGSKQGFNMIPTLSWQNRDMLARVTDLIGSMYPQVNTVYLMLSAPGVQRTPWLYSRLEDIAEHLAPLPFRYMICGLESGWAIRALRDVLPQGNFHLVAVRPWMAARGEFVGFENVEYQRGLIFRRFVQRLEEWHRGENLPDLPPRPENPWNDVLANL